MALFPGAVTCRALPFSLLAPLALYGGVGAEQKDRFNEPPQTTDGKTIEPPRRTSGEPVEVSLGLYLIQVSNLDQIQQTFEIEGYLEASWSDPRLAFDAAAFGATKKVY